MSSAQCKQLYELWKKAGLIKHKKTPESNRAFKARVATLEAKTDKSSDESLFEDEKLKANNRNNPALDRKGNSIRKHLMVRAIHRAQSAQHVERQSVMFSL